MGRAQAPPGTGSRRPAGLPVRLTRNPPRSSCPRRLSHLHYLGLPIPLSETNRNRPESPLGAWMGRCPPLLVYFIVPVPQTPGTAEFSEVGSNFILGFVSHIFSFSKYSGKALKKLCTPVQQLWARGPLENMKKLMLAEVDWPALKRGRDLRRARPRSQTISAAQGQDFPVIRKHRPGTGDWPGWWFP